MITIERGPGYGCTCPNYQGRKQSHAASLTVRHGSAHHHTLCGVQKSVAVVCPVGHLPVDEAIDIIRAQRRDTLPARQQAASTKRGLTPQAIPEIPAHMPRQLSHAVQAANLTGAGRTRVPPAEGSAILGGLINDQ